jgi:nitrogen regulatory protein PII
MDLKKITAIIRSDQLEDVENRLRGPDVPGITVDQVKGYGEYANFFARDWMSRCARIEIVADGRQARRIANVIMDVVHTGARGDGIVYITPVEEVYRIRDRHASRSTATCPRCRAVLRLRERRRRKPADAASTRQAVSAERHSVDAWSLREWCALDMDGAVSWKARVIARETR